MNMADKIKCAECEYCKEFRPVGNTRSKFTCEHPNYKYIQEYFEKNRISKMPSFIGYGKRFSHEVPIKTSPAWCPEKAVIK